MSTQFDETLEYCVFNNKFDSLTAVIAENGGHTNFIGMFSLTRSIYMAHRAGSGADISGRNATVVSGTVYVRS